MARATEDLVRQPKLLQIGQPLELPRVVELGGQRRQIKVFVHRVVEVLRTPTRACSAATAVRSFGAAQQRGAFVHCAALTGGRSCHLPLVASLGSLQRHKHEPPQPRAGQSCCLLHPWNHRSSHWRSTYLAVPPRQASVCFATGAATIVSTGAFSRCEALRKLSSSDSPPTLCCDPSTSAKSSMMACCTRAAALRVLHACQSSSHYHQGCHALILALCSCNCSQPACNIHSAPFHLKSPSALLLL